MSKSGADTELEVTLIVVASLAANPRSLRGAWRSFEELGGAAEKAIPRKISAH